MLNKPAFVRLARQLIPFACVLVAGLSAAGAAGAEDAAEFYRGKTIRLLVGYGPGGGFDINARLIAPWLEKATGAEVLVENRPGGGGLVALNQLYSQDQDGLTIMLVNGRAAVMAQLLDLEGARFDLRRLHWLGRLSGEPSVVLAGAGSGLSSVDDMLGADSIKWAGGGKTDSIADSAACVSEALGLDSRIIIGYKGAKESALAVMRGEADALVVSVGSARKLAANGDLLPLALLDRRRHESLPDLPTLFEAADLSDDAARWIDFWAGMSRMGRSFAVGPEVPQERVDYLISLLSVIAGDAGFVAEVEKSGYTVDFLPAGEIRELAVATLGGLDEEALGRVRHVVFDKYYR